MDNLPLYFYTASLKYIVLISHVRDLYTQKQVTYRVEPIGCFALNYDFMYVCKGVNTNLP